MVHAEIVEIIDIEKTQELVLSKFVMKLRSYSKLEDVLLVQITQDVSMKEHAEPIHVMIIKSLILKDTAKLVLLTQEDKIKEHVLQMIVL